MSTRPNPQKLLTWWALESDGSDSHTGENDFTAINGPISHTAAKVGNGVSFDGTAKHYEIASPHDGEVGGDDFTITGWAYGNAWTIKPTASWIYKCGNTVSTGGVLVRFVREDPYTYAQLACTLLGNDGLPGSELVIHGGEVEPLTWYFFALVHDVSAKSLTVYGGAGGSLAEEASDTYTFAAATPSYPGWIGRSASQYFNGLIDELSIWNAALSLAEVQYLYNSGDGISYESFIADAGANNYNKVDLSLGVRL